MWLALSFRVKKDSFGFYLLIWQEKHFKDVLALVDGDEQYSPFLYIL